MANMILDSNYVLMELFPNLIEKKKNNSVTSAKIQLTSMFKKLGLFNNLWHYMQKTIGELASISEKPVVARFFKTTMQKLLKVTKEVASKAENSNSMEVDDSSKESSLSLARWDLWHSYFLKVVIQSRIFNLARFQWYKALYLYDCFWWPLICLFVDCVGRSCLTWQVLFCQV